MYLSAYDDAGDDIHVVCGDPCALLDHDEKAVCVHVVVPEPLRDDICLAVFEIDPDLLFLLFVFAHAPSFAFSASSAMIPKISFMISSIPLSPTVKP